MYIPGEVLGVNPIAGVSAINARHRHTQMYDVHGQPDIIARDGRKQPFESYTGTDNEALTRELFRLAAYGLSTPGIGTLATAELDETDQQDYGRFYATTYFVEGDNVFYDMDKVPLDVIRGTADGIIEYYQHMATDWSDSQYLADISLRQCMYGRIPALYSGVEPQVYMVDIGNIMTNRKNAQIKFPSFGNILRRLDEEMLVLTDTFSPEEFETQANQLFVLARFLGITWRIPNTYSLIKPEHSCGVG